MRNLSLSYFDLPHGLFIILGLFFSFLSVFFNFLGALLVFCGKIGSILKDTPPHRRITVKKDPPKTV